MCGGWRSSSHSFLGHGYGGTQMEKIVKWQRVTLAGQLSTVHYQLSTCLSVSKFLRSSITYVPISSVTQLLPQLSESGTEFQPPADPLPGFERAGQNQLAGSHLLPRDQQGDPCPTGAGSGGVAGPG